MAGVSLKSLLAPKAVIGVVEAMGCGVTRTSSEAGGLAVEYEGTTLGWVSGPPEAAQAVAGFLTHLAAKETERRALGTEVLHLYREVHLIDQLSEQLAALLDLDAVCQSALDQARRLIMAARGCILTVDRDAAAAWFGGPLLGANSALVQSIVQRGVAEIIDDCAADWRTPEIEGALICAPLRAKQRTVGVIALAKGGSHYTTADLKLLNTIALQTAAAIENAMLCAEMVAATRDREQLAAIQRELDTARTIQHSLVPRIFPPFPERTDFDLHAQMTSAKAVGGDFFDFFLIDEENLGVVIGDVSGKGTPSALFMAVTRTHVKTIAQRGIAPEVCMHEVNATMVRDRASSMFATCFYGIFNTRTGELRYCSAGHNPPWILRVSGQVEAVTEQGGLPLGMFAGKPYTGATAWLGAGDTLFLYTDGVSEADNVDQEEFSDERLAATLGEATSFSCRELIGHVMERLAAFTAGAAQSDDITMLALSRTSGS